jgi:hypothetical protein
MQHKLTFLEFHCNDILKIKDYVALEKETRSARLIIPTFTNITPKENRICMFKHATLFIAK